MTEVQSSWEDFQNLLFRLEGLTFKGACQMILKRSLQRASGNVALSLRLDFPISDPIPTPRVIDCIVCQQSPAEILRSIKHEFILSEITRTDQPLAGLEVHMQAIMRMLLGDIEGAMSLYRRADLTFYKQYGFRSRVPSSRSEDTEMIMLSCRVGEQVFSRLAGRLMRTGTALSGPMDDPNPLLNRLEDSIKPRDSRFEKISHLRRNLIQSLLECEFKDLDIENPIETHETDGMRLDCQLISLDSWIAEADINLSRAPSDRTTVLAAVGTSNGWRSTPIFATLDGLYLEIRWSRVRPRLSDGSGSEHRSDPSTSHPSKSFDRAEPRCGGHLLGRQEGNRR